MGSIKDTDSFFLLITPLRVVDYPLEPALGPLSLYSFAKKNGFDGDLLDFNEIITRENFFEYEDIVRATLRKWMENHPEVKVVGITALFASIFVRVLGIAKIIKEIREDVVVVIGGNHPSLFHKEILENCPEIDYVVIGEGEEQFVGLLELYCHGTIDRSEIENGIAYVSDGKVVVKEKKRYIEDLGTLGGTDYGKVNFAKYHTPDMDTFYNPKGHDIIMCMPIATSRACPFSCNFCSMNAVMGRKFRPRPNSIVLEELKKLYYDHGIRYFRIIDDCSTANKKRSMELFSSIAASDMDVSFEFYNGMSLRTLDSELIDVIVEAGLLRGSCAIETGSDYLRNKIMNKNLSTEKIYEVYDYFEKKHPHVWLIGLFLIGLPEETTETLDATVEMIKKLKNIYPVLNIIIPFPGTRLWDQCIRDNLLLVDTKDVWKNSLAASPPTLESAAKNEGDWCAHNFKKIEQSFLVQPYNLSLDQLAEYYRELLRLKAESWQRIEQRKKMAQI